MSQAVQVPPRRGVLATVTLSIAVLSALATVALMLPATTVVEKSRCVQVDQNRACTKSVVEPVELAIMPGDAMAVGPRISVTGPQTYPATGGVLFVTVSQSKVDLLDWLALRHNTAAQLFSHREYYGDQTPQQQRQASLEMMNTAKDVAEFVAFDRAGLKPQLVEGEVVVAGLCLANDDQGRCTMRSPAAAKLQVADRIVEVNRRPIAVIEDLQTALQGVAPGASINLKISRKEQDGPKTLEFDVPTIASPREPQRAIIGFLPQDTRRVQLPEGAKVEITTGEISGPSAGAAFTLTLIDRLTPGNLLGNARVAVTGTIDLDGRIGAIGGLTAKTQAVRNAGASYFLVPVAQGEDDIAAARRVAGGEVTIIPVATIDDALAELVKLGGDRLQPPTS